MEGPGFRVIPHTHTRNDGYVPGRSAGFHSGGDARVQPAGVHSIASEVVAVDEVQHVVGGGAYLPADHEAVAQRSRHGAQGRLTGVATGEQMSELGRIQCEV